MLPMDLAALAASCCQSWELFYQNPDDSSPRQYLSSILFLKAFVDSSTPFAPYRHLSVRWEKVAANTVPVELMIHYYLRQLGAVKVVVEDEEDEVSLIYIFDTPLGIVYKRE